MHVLSNCPLQLLSNSDADDSNAHRVTALLS